MKTYVLSKLGVFLDPTTIPPGTAGYIFSFQGKGFDPDSRIMLADETRENKTREATPEEIATHNLTLANMELEQMQSEGKGVLYLTKEDGRYYVATWTGAGKTHCSFVRQSWHNMAGKNSRTDVYFVFRGEQWHGVNIGDNQICRVHRLKKQK